MPDLEDMDAPLGTQNDGEPVAVTPQDNPPAPEIPEPTAEEVAAAEDAEAAQILADEEAAHKPKTGSARLKAQRDEARAETQRLQAELARLSQAQQPTQPPVPQAPIIPTIDQFVAANPQATYEDYESFKSAKLLELAEHRVIARIQAETQAKRWDEGVAKAKEEIPDLDEVQDVQALIGAGVNLQGVMRDAILRMPPEVGPKVLHHLAQNVPEARRIAGLPPIEAAVELGALKAALVSKATTKPTPKLTQAPPPLSPARSTGASSPRPYANQEDF